MYYLVCNVCKSGYYNKYSTCFHTDNLYDRIGQWKCQSCKLVTRRKDNNTPFRKQRLSTPTDITDMSCNDITQTVDITENGAGAGCLPNKVKKIKYSQYKAIMDSFKAFTDRLINEMDAEFKKLTDSYAEIMPQDVKRYSFVIHCVPENRNEDLVSIVRNLLTKIKIPPSEAYFMAVKRLTKKYRNFDKPGGILVTMRAECDRDNVLLAYKRYNKDNRANQLNCTHLGVDGKECFVYISEHLSPQIKQLHAMARLAGKELAYKYTWVKNGRVYMKKNNRSDAIRVYWGPNNTVEFSN